MPYFAKPLIAVLLTIFATGCATTRVDTHVVGDTAKLCQATLGSQSALVLWGATWRENQKEPALREEIASRAIQTFFTESPCYSKVEFVKVVSGRSAIALSDSEALELATLSTAGYTKVVVLRVEELGPLLTIYPSPILWEGATEVMLRVRVLDTSTSALDADVATHWKNGGAFVVKGLWTLEDDLRSALKIAFGSPPLDER